MCTVAVLLHPEWAQMIEFTASISTVRKNVVLYVATESLVPIIILSLLGLFLSRSRRLAIPNGGNESARLLPKRDPANVSHIPNAVAG
jgi:hypothetical protein